MAVLTKEAFRSKWNSLFADNTSRDISELDMRDFKDDISHSFLGVMGESDLFVTPEMFGAAGDGTTDDSIALQSAINSGKPVFLGRKNYRVNSTITLGPSDFIRGCGEESVISTTSDISILEIVGVAADDSDVYISDLTLIGDSAGSSQIGLSIISPGSDFYTRNRIINVDFKNFGAYGLYCQKNTIDFKGTIYAVNCFAQGCGIGFFIDDGSEYNHFSNCAAYANDIGVKFIGGNNTWVGGGIEDNTTGIQMTGPATNDGKCIFSGCTINHNVTAIDFDGVQEGALFIGNYIVFGDWSFVDSDKVKFEGNVIDTQAEDIVITNCDLMEFSNNSFKVDHNFVITGSNPKWFNNTWHSGNIPTEVHNSLEGELAIGSANAFYFGDPNTDGTWRIIRSGSNLLRQRRESGSYVTKATDTP